MSRLTELNEDTFPKPEGDCPVLESPSYSEVYWKYLSSNRPCVIRGLTESWPCRKLWVSDGRLNTAAMTARYSACRVPVVDDCDRSTVSFGEYVSLHWEGRSSDRPQYLKDWHLRRERPHDDFYTVPECFSSDWLNEHAVDVGADDFMFVYIGPRGSHTPLHEDVYSSFSWSANVVGTKEWLLYPPGRPEAEPLRIVQSAGEAVFVPSGWQHRVVNLEDAVSINHNWINACNVAHVWTTLLKSLRAVQREIEEFKASDGWAEHCRLMLRATHGMDCDGFLDVLRHITKKRIRSLNGGEDVTFGGWTFGRRHNVHDLTVVRNLLRHIASDKSCDGLFQSSEPSDLLKTVKEIDDTLSI